LRTEVSKFGLHEPTSLSEAVSLLSQYGPEAAVISGGSDIISRNKNRIKQHMFTHLIDISGLSLSGITNNSNSIAIGATTPINQVATDPNVNSAMPVLAQAAGQVATLQIRNVGTVAGDVLQEVWCPYLRNNYDCWRNGGNVCYGAIGDNRYYHSIFGGRLCYANHAGDIGPALTALGASATIQGSIGQRTISMNELLPGISVIGGVVKENTVGQNEILTQFNVPIPSSTSKSIYYKIRDRGTWDFALASAAVILDFSGSNISSASIVLGGVSVIPHRALAAESYLIGQSISGSNAEQVFTGAAKAAVSDATPLTYGTGNAYRMTLAQGAVKKALRAISQM